MATQTATKPSLTIKRRLNAPPAKVYAAWTDPQMIARWFGPGRRRERARPRPTCASAAATTSSCMCRGDQHDVMRRLSRGGAEREAGLHLGLEEHAGARIAGHGHVQAGWRRHAADPAARAVLRRGRARPPPARLDRRARQARKAVRLNNPWSKKMAWSHGHFHWNELLTTRRRARQALLQRHDRLELRGHADAGRRDLLGRQ